MSRFAIALPIALALCCDAHGREASPQGGASQNSKPAELADQRRMVLREALKLPLEDAPAAARQLSAQEKAELRQQLRQQRLDLPK